VNLEGFGQLPLELHAVQPGHSVKSAVICKEKRGSDGAYSL